MKLNPFNVNYINAGMDKDSTCRLNIGSVLEQKKCTSLLLLSGIAKLSDDVAGRLGVGTQPYTDLGLSTGFAIKKIHVEELRQRIRAIAG